MPLSREALLEHVVRLGKEFRRRRMGAHAHRLRVYFLALKRGLVAPAQPLEVKWGPTLVIEWMRTLRLQPYGKDLEVRPRGSNCARCEENERQPAVATTVTFPGGARMKCACGLEWIEPD